MTDPPLSQHFPQRGRCRSGVRPLLPPVQPWRLGLLPKDREHDDRSPLSQVRGNRPGPAKAPYPPSASESSSRRAIAFRPWPNKEQVKVWRAVELDATGENIEAATNEAEVLVSFEAARIALRRVFEGSDGPDVGAHVEVVDAPAVLSRTSLARRRVV